MLLTAIGFISSAGVGKFNTMFVHTPAHTHRTVTLNRSVEALGITFRRVASKQIAVETTADCLCGIGGEDEFLYCAIKRMRWTVQLHNENHAHLQCMVDPPSRSIDTILSDSPHCFGHCHICRWKVWCTSRSVGERSNKRRTNLQWKSVTMSFYLVCVVHPHLIVFQVVQLL